MEDFQRFYPFFFLLLDAKVRIKGAFGREAIK